MSAKPERFYGGGDLHFLTFSCYQRRPLLARSERCDLFLETLERVRRRYRLVFLAYVIMPEHVHLLVIMDNLAAHKVAGVRELIAATGARLIYLPPYSPDFNPIEQAWSKIKQLLRSAKARSVAALEQAIAEALAAITPENASAWFAHCNYGLR